MKGAWIMRIQIWLRVVGVMVVLVLALGACQRKQNEQAELKQNGQAEVKKGSMEPGHKVHAEFTSHPPPAPASKEPEQGALPPVPVGPFVPAPGAQIPATKGGEVNPSTSQKPAEDPPEDFRFFSNNSLRVAGVSSIPTNEPSLAARDNPAGSK